MADSFSSTVYNEYGTGCLYLNHNDSPQTGSGKNIVMGNRAGAFTVFWYYMLSHVWAELQKKEDVQPQRSGRLQTKT